MECAEIATSALMRQRPYALPPRMAMVMTGMLKAMNVSAVFCMHSQKHMLHQAVKLNFREITVKAAIPYIPEASAPRAVVPAQCRF